MSFILTDSKQRKRVMGMALATVLATGAFAGPVAAAYADEAPAANDTTTTTTPSDQNKTDQVQPITLEAGVAYVSGTDDKAVTKTDGQNIKAEKVQVIAPGKYSLKFTANKEAKAPSGAYQYFTSTTVKDGVVSSVQKATEQDTKDGDTQQVDLTQTGAVVVVTATDGVFTLTPVTDPATAPEQKPDTPAVKPVEVVSTADGIAAKTAKDLQLPAGDYTVVWEAAKTDSPKVTVKITKAKPDDNTGKTDPADTEKPAAGDTEKPATGDTDKPATDDKTPTETVADYTGTADKNGAINWVDKDGKTVDHVTIADNDVFDVEGEGKLTFTQYQAATAFTVKADADSPESGTLADYGMTKDGAYKVSITPNAKDGSILASLGAEADKDGNVSSPDYVIAYAGSTAGKAFVVTDVKTNVTSKNQVLNLKTTDVINVAGGSVTFTPVTETPEWNAPDKTPDQETATYDFDLSKVKNRDGVSPNGILGIVGLNKDDTLPKPAEKIGEDQASFADEYVSVLPGTYKVTYTAKDSKFPNIVGSYYKGQYKDGTLTVAKDVQGAKFNILGQDQAAEKDVDGNNIPSEVVITFDQGGLFNVAADANAGILHLTQLKTSGEQTNTDENKTPAVNQPAGDQGQQQNNAGSDKLANTGVGILASILAITGLGGSAAGAEILRRKNRHNA